MNDLQTMLGLRPLPAAPTVAEVMPTVPQGAPAVQSRQQPQPPAPPPTAQLDDLPPFRLREPWEIPGLVVEPDDDADGDHDEDDYADDPDDDYDGYDEEGEDYADAAYHGRGGRGWSPTGHAASGGARWPGRPPLGSYASRQAALSQQRRRSPVRFVLPVLALAAIGFGGIKLFTARAGEQLSTQGSQRTPTNHPTPTKASIAPAPSAAGTTVITSFAGYPGQQGRDGGQLAISSVATGGGQELAVGSADGYPAVWRQGAGSSWSLADPAINGVLAGRPGNQTLGAVTDGPAGWLAVGGVVSGTQQHPVVITSPDGLTWQAADGSAAFGAPGLYTYGAAAGRIDYVIVGEQAAGNTVTPAAWWSAGLGTWSQGSVTASGTGQPGGMFAVTVGAEQFIAAGADGSKPAVWTSPNGQQWTVTDLALPAGMSKAVLREVVCTGNRVVAVGNAETAQGATVAFAEVSNDGGTTWHEVGISSQGPQAAVTALTGSGAGYVAAGQSAQSGTPAAVVWTSPDGMTWAPAGVVPDPAGGKVQVIASLTSASGTVSGVGSASTKSGESPVVYTAPTP
jgi:hypothetical protein